MTGMLETADLGRWYCAADVFVSASRNEVGPLATIEAGLCNTATIAPRVPGFADRVVDGVSGALADQTPGALGELVARALSDRADAHRMGRAAAELMAGHTPASSARLLVDGYESAVAERSAAARRQRRGRPVLKPDAD
jgi:glycosyltransferase involved in cell wall biosynthesis